MLENKKHEKFCQLWHETGNKSEAYRKSHPNSVKWKDATVHNKASALSKLGEVSARLEQLQKDGLDSHGVTVGSLLKELERCREIALDLDTPQTSAAINAIMGKAKLVGLDKVIIEQKTTTHVKTFSDMYGDS